MNLKVLFVLCLLGTAMVCNVVMVTLNAAEENGCRASTHIVHDGYIANIGTEPAGDPIGGGGWPGPQAQL